MNILHFKHVIIRNLKQAKEIILENFKETIKSKLQKGENDYLDLLQKFTKPINSIDEFIEKSDFFLSFDIKHQIGKIRETFDNCEEIYNELEKHYTDLDYKYLQKLFLSYAWNYKFQIAKQNFENELQVKQPLFENELLLESKQLIEEIDVLDSKLEIINKMSDFEKSEDNEFVNNFIFLFIN